MTNLGDRLREADPLAAEPALAADDVQRMRRVVLAARHGRNYERAMRPSVRWAMVAAVLTLAATAGAVRFLQQPADPDPATGFAAARETTAVRQMQFVTPGGTRVIWTFNPEFR